MTPFPLRHRKKELKAMKFLGSFLVIAILAAAAPAQLSGAYTIDSSQATGGTNFATFIDAASALAGVGISGPVVFVVSPGVGPYAGFSIVNPIVGSSATNTVTFIGGGSAIISGPAAGFTQAIRLGTSSISTGTGPSDIIIDGFEVTGAPSGAGIIVTRCSNITVRNCRVHTCGGGINFATCTDTVIEDNEVFNVGNTVGTPGNATYAGGVASYSNNHNCVIQRNKIHDCTGNGIFVGSSGSATAPNGNIVINNMVWNTPGLGSYPGGIAIRRTGMSVVSNNSVWMPAGTAFGGIHLMGAAADPQPVEISNNIVKHDGTGACFRFEAATIVPPATFDYNLYDPAPSAAVGAVGATLHATLAAFQGLASPNMAGKELNTAVGSAGYISASDLHITPGSLAFNSGSTVAQVSVDIDLQPRPLGGIPDRGADETPAMGLFAAFDATPTSGSAPLMVNFTDMSFTTAPGGVTSWAWDFQDDGTNDAFGPNPSFAYTCPGTYSVRLTVMDGTNPTSSMVRTNLISVSDQPFVMTTLGNGAGNLTIVPVPTTCYPTTVEGWTLISLSTPGPVGTGPFFGLYPDFFTVQFILTPIAPGSPIHFPALPGVYPNGGAFVLPNGTFTPLTGVTMDAVEILVGPGLTFLKVTNVARVTF